MAPSTPSVKTRKRLSKSSHRNNQPPALREKCLWISSVEELPIYDHTPWDFYEPYLTLDPDRTLALCNHGTESRVIRTSRASLAEVSEHHLSQSQHQSPIAQIQHRNFIHYYEIYLFKGQGFAVSEYIEFCLEDILQLDVYPTEPEVAYIISQVR